MHYLKALKGKEIKRFISESWSVSAPMTLIMIFEFFIGITDIYIAGKINKEIQASYGFVIQLYFMFIIIANALATGTVSVVSRLFSSQDREELAKAVFSVLIIAASSGMIFGLSGVLLTPYLIHIVRIPENLKPLGIPLAQIYATGLIFHYLLINTNGILRSCKKIRLSLLTMTVVCITNIALNFIFVFHTTIGYRGIALSTVISSIIGCLINLHHVRVLIPSLYARLSGIHILNILRISWPFGLSQALWQMHSMVLYLILSSLPARSVEILTAFSAGMRIESAAFLPAIAFHMANAVIVGNLIGEKRDRDAYRAGIITMLMGLCIVIIIALIIVAIAPALAGLLSKNPIVIRETMTYLYINMLGEPFMAAWVILAGALSGAGDTRSIMFIIVVCAWFIRIPLCYFLVVDRAAIDAAIALNINYGGSIPRGRKAEDGFISPKYDKLTEIDSPDYPARAEKNVMEADATLIFTMNIPTGGTASTIDFTRRHHKPYLVLDLNLIQAQYAEDRIISWLNQTRPKVLNIAGPRESKCPGIYEITRNIIRNILNFYERTNHSIR